MRMRIQNTCYNASFYGIVLFVASSTLALARCSLSCSLRHASPLLLSLFVAHPSFSRFFGVQYLYIARVLNAHVHHAWSLHIKASGFTYTWSQGQMTVVLATVGMAKACPNYSSIIKNLPSFTLSAQLWWDEGEVLLWQICHHLFLGKCWMIVLHFLCHFSPVEMKYLVLSHPSGHLRRQTVFELRRIRVKSSMVPII